MPNKGFKDTTENRMLATIGMEYEKGVSIPRPSTASGTSRHAISYLPLFWPQRKGLPDAFRPSHRLIAGLVLVTHVLEPNLTGNRAGVKSILYHSLNKVKYDALVEKDAAPFLCPKPSR